jgi:hypothetical protein
LAEAIIREQYRDVLCIGTPTVYGAIRAKGGNAFLVDRNPLLTRTLSAETFLITEISAEEELMPYFNRKFDAAVLDPPWYGEAYHLWVRRTLPLLRSGAAIFLVLFRRLTTFARFLGNQFKLTGLTSGDDGAGKYLKATNLLDALHLIENTNETHRRIRCPGR